MRNNVFARLLCLATVLVLCALGCGTPTSIQAFDPAPADDASLPNFTVSGTVRGLVGTGLVLQNGGTESLAIDLDGTFTFAGLIETGATYAITVGMQPFGPSQICQVSRGNGTIGSSNVADVSVDCMTSTFTVGGSVIGLEGAGLRLQNNGADLLSVSAGAFVFPVALESGSSFNVSVQTQPGTPAQTCNVTGGTGTLGSGDVTSVVVNCATDSFTVGGIVSGLVGTVVLQNNGADDLALSSNGAFAFPIVLLSGAPYAISVQSQPIGPSQTCLVTAGTGTVGGTAITSVRVDCTTDEFVVSGTVAGLVGSGLVLQNNSGDNYAIASNGTFSFSTLVTSGTPYAVTVLTQPTGPTQVCSVTNGSGTVGAVDISDVIVTCTTNSFSVGGTLSGLSSGSVVLQNNGGDNLTLSANGNFTFTTPLASGSTYNISVAAQPAGLLCTAFSFNDSGIVATANITNADVVCAAAPTGGTITTTGGYRIHTFTSAGTFQSHGAVDVDFLVVGGGGGGGSGDGGGGGAGSVIVGPMFLAIPSAFPVGVGAGGVGGGTGDVGSASQNGGDSLFAGQLAVGGGRGGQEDNVAGGGVLNAGGAGGSGGGFGGANAPTPFPLGGAGIIGEGFDGGTRGPSGNSIFGMGGGGGAGGFGGDGGNGLNVASGGDGGVGISISLSGTAVFYGGGGGGSGRGTSGGAGGQGGGGAGGLGSGSNGTAGTANTGGGGGGGGDQASIGGSGGSGIVIIRYRY